MKRAIMATGGIDSTLLMYQFRDYDPIIMTFNFGQKIWDVQKELIEYHMKELQISTPLIELNIDYFDWQRKSGLFEHGWSPEEKDDDIHSFEKLPHESYFIEGKNSIMLCYALAYCAAHDIDEMICGFEYEANEWPNIRTPKLIADDTSPHFVDTMNMIALFGFSKVVRIRAPFYENRMDKKAIIEECIHKKINLDKTYTCYFHPGPCGKCDNCNLKNDAIKAIYKEKYENNIQVQAYFRKFPFIR